MARRGDMTPQRDADANGDVVVFTPSCTSTTVGKPLVRSFASVSSGAAVEFRWDRKVVCTSGREGPTARGLPTRAGFAWLRANRGSGAPIARRFGRESGSAAAQGGKALHRSATSKAYAHIAAVT